MERLAPELRQGFSVGAWQVEPTLNRVVRGSESIQVEPKVMHVLCCLAERPGRTVTKEQFMDRVWGGTVVTDDVLARCISELRKVLGDDWRDPQYVETIRKSGYRLVAPIRTGDASSSSFGDARRSLWGAVRRVSERAHRGWTAGSLLALLVLTAGLLWGLRAVQWGSESAQSEIAPVQSTTPFTSYPGREAEPALSPDGTRIAFVWDGGAGRHQNLYVKQIDSETPLRITDAEADEWSPSWSPDGQFVAFVRHRFGRYGLFVVPAIGGAVRRVVSTGDRAIHSVDWSPDTSRQMLAVSVRRGPHQAFGLHLLALNQDSLRPLTVPPAYTQGDTHPAFSLDGSRIAFARGVVADAQQVYILPITGGTPRPVGLDSATVDGIDWSTDGTNLILAATKSGSSGLWRVPVRGSDAPEWIALAGEGSELKHPTVAAHEPRLAYTQHTRTANIWEVAQNPRSGAYATRPVLASTRWDGYPDIAPTDTAEIVFASRRSGHMEIWKAESDGSRPLQLTTFESESHSPRWSPDGLRIAFVSRVEGGGDLYVMDTDGRSVRQVTSTPAEDMLPRWSADGNALYFTSNRTGTWQVWQLWLDDGRLEQVTRRGGLEAQVGADGSALYVLRPDTTGIWRRPLTPPALAATSPRVTTASRGARIPVRTVAQVVRPDSTPTQPFELVIPDIAPEDAGNWRVTAHGVYYVRRSEGSPELVRFDPESGITRHVATLKDVPFQPSLAVAFAGGRFLHTQIDRDESDVMLVEPFR